MRSFTWGVDTIHSVKFNPIEVKTKITNFIWWLGSWIEEDVCQNLFNLFSDSMIGFSRLCYNPGPKVLGHLPFFTWFCVEFAANLRYTLINMASTRFFPHPPLTKLRPIKCTRYVKGVWLVTPNTVRGGGGGSTLITFSSPKTQSVPNVLTRIVSVRPLWTCEIQGALHCCWFLWKQLRFNFSNC